MYLLVVKDWENCSGNLLEHGGFVKMSPLCHQIFGHYDLMTDGGNIPLLSDRWRTTKTIGFRLIGHLLTALHLSAMNTLAIKSTNSAQTSLDRCQSRQSTNANILFHWSEQPTDLMMTMTMGMPATITIVDGRWSIVVADEDSGKCDGNDTIFYYRHHHLPIKSLATH